MPTIKTQDKQQIPSLPTADFMKKSQFCFGIFGIFHILYLVNWDIWDFSYFIIGKLGYLGGDRFSLPSLLNIKE